MSSFWWQERHILCYMWNAAYYLVPSGWSRLSVGSLLDWMDDCNHLSINRSLTQCSFNKNSWSASCVSPTMDLTIIHFSFFWVHLHTKFIISLGQGQGGEVRSESHTGQTLVVRKKWVTHLGARPKPHDKLKFKSLTKRKRNKNNRCY